LSSLVDLILNILEFYEFKIIEVQPKYILGEKEESSVAVIGLNTKTSPSIDELMGIMKELPQVPDKYILATLHDVTPQIKEYADHENIEIWDRENLEEEAGRAMLGNIEKTQEEEDIPDVMTVDEAVDVTVTENETKSPTDEEKTRPLPPPPEDLGETIITPTISMTEVSEISKKIVQGFRFDLELIPYYLFDYSCEIIVEGLDETAQSLGTVAVNGLTNNVEQWDFEIETVNNIEGSHTKLEPRIDIKKALQSARESAIAWNTKEIQTQDDRGSVTIYEKKKMRPNEDAIVIKKRGLVYLPVWCVEGSNGVMIINATSGKVIKEDLY
jgi:hypothetical protein